MIGSSSDGKFEVYRSMRCRGVVLFLGVYGNDFFDRFFQLNTIELHGMCALHAPNTDVASDTDDRKAEGAAGVWLFELEDIVNVEAYDLHRRKTPFRELLSFSGDKFFLLCDGAYSGDIRESA